VFVLGLGQHFSSLDQLYEVPHSSKTLTEWGTTLWWMLLTMVATSSFVAMKYLEGKVNSRFYTPHLMYYLFTRAKWSGHFRLLTWFRSRQSTTWHIDYLQLSVPPTRIDPHITSLLLNQSVSPMLLASVLRPCSNFRLSYLYFLTSHLFAARLFCWLSLTFTLLSPILDTMLHTLRVSCLQSRTTFGAIRY
jgi:hypothetical protein